MWLDKNDLFQASLGTRVSQWWTSIPFITGIIVIVCGAIYAICLLTGYDSFVQVCFLPGAVTSHYEGKFYYIDGGWNLSSCLQFPKFVAKFQCTGLIQQRYSMFQFYMCCST